MKLITKLVGALLIITMTSAVADFKTVDLAYEVPFAHLRMPASSNGSVTFKQCDACEEFTVSVTPATQYLINGQNVQLSEFRNVMFRARSLSSNAGNAATVLRNLESDVAISIAVYL